MTFIRTTLTAAVLCAAAGCSFVLDKQTDQCVVDADCVHFGGHPSCQQGLCVASGLGPENCVPGAPKTQSDYLNACSTSTFEPFNDCNRLGLCGDTQLPATQVPTNPVIPPLVNMVVPPSNLCTDGAPGAVGSPNMIYLYGSADFGPLLQAAQPALSALPTPFRAVFQAASSCQGVDKVFNADSTKRVIFDPPPPQTNGGWAFYFDANNQQVNCRLDPVGAPSPVGAPVDIGISDLYAQTCSSSSVPGPTVAEYLGPVVPFVLSVPATSSEKSISAAAAHFVFGLGGKAPPGTNMKDATPWIDPNNYAIRSGTSGSTVLTALLADVPTKFWGVDRLSTENLRDTLLSSTSSNASIGILSIDFNDKYRGNLKALYLQAKNQNVGYLPDSSPTTYDKVNVRDGHYPLWGYVHFFTRVGPGGVPTPAANAMVLLFRVEKIGQQLVDDIVKASLTPQCAMKVTRMGEMGDFTPRTGFQCGCYFDFKTKNKTDCQTCSTAEDCPGQHPCNYGYCELTGS
jgi:hypothetical protein